MARNSSVATRRSIRRSSKQATAHSDLATLVELIGDLAERVDAMERATAKIGSPQSILKSAGRFKDDPIFEEIVELGRKARQKINRRSLANGSAK